MKVHMICKKYEGLYAKLVLSYTEDEELVVITNGHKQQPTLLTSICRSLVRHKCSYGRVALPCK